MTEARNVYMRGYYARNRETIIARVKRYRESNLEKVRAYDRSRSHQDRHGPLKRYMQMAWRATRRFGETIHWSVFARIAMLPCVTCGEEPADGVDHIVSKPKGGHNVIDNLQPMCRHENVAKGVH